MFNIKNFTPRLYQETILATCIEKNTLVVLPTGMGKTNIFLMLAAYRLRQYPDSKILFIGPTRPLIDQYFSVFAEHFEIDKEEMAILTGFVKPEKREELWQKSKIIFSTPQGLENDIISNRIKLEEVCLLGIDECHRAVGDYSYVWIAKQYYKKALYPRIIALTASPGSDMDKIDEVCKNLYIEGIEVRTEYDPDVRDYVQETDIKWVSLELPESFIQIKKFLETALRERLQKLKKWGILQRANLAYVNRKDLLQLQGQLHSRIAKGEKDFILWNAISVTAEVMKLYHALELIETQGISTLYNYLEKLNNEARTTKVKAVKNLVNDLNFKSAWLKTQTIYDNNIEHPKLDKLKEIIKDEAKDDVKIIIFTQYRDSASKIVEELNRIDNVKAKIFVGQLKKGETGLSQKEQKKTLDNFRVGMFNVLVATSIAEEGLDIPAVDIVIFYEPIPSVIRHVQRKGRTGRQEKGRVIILMTKNTRDETYRWSAFHKEKRMYRTLEKMKSKMGFEVHKQELTLDRFSGHEEVAVFADDREKGSGIIKELIELGAKINLKRLDSADYLLSSRAAVEVKTVEDFVNSIVDGRLLEQLKVIKQSFERPLVIVEGENDIYSVRNVHPNAIRGMLATIVVSYGIPILQTRNFRETAALLYAIAKREQEETSKDFSLHQNKKPLTLKEQQEYIISSLPGVGAALAKPLLQKFGSVKNVVNAEEKELKEVEKIGDKKAKAIKDVVEKGYEG